MPVVTQMQETEVQHFHRKLLPEQRPEKDWLFHLEEEGFRAWSSKKINAKAHCTAAYLMSRGIGKGSKVLTLSSQSPFYLVVDLALQFLGAVNITLNLDCDSDLLDKCFRDLHPEFVFIEKDEAYLRHNQLKAYKDQIKEVCIDLVLTDNLPPEKLVTFEIVVNLGKSIWREESMRLQEMKLSTSPSDLYSIVIRPGASLWSKVSFSQLLETTRQASKYLESGHHHRIMSLLGPEQLLQRSYGFFGPMLLQLPVYTLSRTQYSSAAFKTIRPSAITASPQTLTDLYEMLPGTFFKKEDLTAKQIEKAHKICEKRSEYLDHHKKVPMMLRFSYSSLRRGLFSKIKVKLGGKLQTIIFGEGPPNPRSEALFRYLGYTFFSGEENDSSRKGA